MSFGNRVFEGLAKWYNESSVSKMISLEPHVGAFIDASLDALATAYDQHIARSNDEFYQHLSAHIHRTLTVEEIMSDNFLKPLFQTMRVVENTKRSDKIKLFARLFARYLNGWDMGDPNSYDKYEEYLKIIDDLSYREFQVLLLLHKTQQDNPETSTLELLNIFKVVAETKLAIPKDQISGYLTRLTRTGFYQLSNGGLSVTSDTGRLTANFTDFLEYIDMKNEGK